MRRILLTSLIGLWLLSSLVFATEIGPGSVSGNWYATGNPFNVNGEITIPTDSILHIHEGVQVIFQGHYKFIINGILEANGVEGDSILFTAADTSVGWHSLRFIDAQDTSRLSYCIVQYGKATGAEPDYWGGGIFCYGSNAVIFHSTIRWNHAQDYHGGINFRESSNAVLEYSNIIENSASEGSGGVGVRTNSDVTIRNCVIANNTAMNSMGGGISMYGASAQISDCQITNNVGFRWGGGIGAEFSTVSINACEIAGNLVLGENGFGGGGTYFYECDVLMTQCTITDNHAPNWVAGGVSIGPGSNATITDCEVAFNSSFQGGGMNIQECEANLTRCDIHDNSVDTADPTSSGGGGISVNAFTSDAHVTLSNCTITGNESAVIAGGIYFGSYTAGGGHAFGTLQNCVIASNYSALRGGGVYDDYSDLITIDRCTVSGNSAGVLCGGIYLDYSAPTITNTIVEGNLRPSGIYFNNSSNATVTYCDVYNNQTANFGGNIPAGLGTLVGINACGDSCDVFMNILQDPLFEDPENGNFQITWANYPTNDSTRSPCIDAGDPATPYDPEGTIADIGAFYFNQYLAVNNHSKLLQPSVFQLYPNYPNPFNSSTALRYSLPQPSEVTLTVHNLLGQKVATLYKGRQPSGVYTVTWDASNVSSGVYFARLNNGTQVSCVKMLLLK